MMSYVHLGIVYFTIWCKNMKKGERGKEETRLFSFPKIGSRKENQRN
jgi:hypothetical protein